MKDLFQKESVSLYFIVITLGGILCKLIVCRQNVFDLKGVAA